MLLIKKRNLIWWFLWKILNNTFDRYGYFNFPALVLLSIPWIKLEYHITWTTRHFEKQQTVFFSFGAKSLEPWVSLGPKCHLCHAKLNIPTSASLLIFPPRSPLTLRIVCSWLQTVGMQCFLFTLANLIHSFNRTTNFLPLLNTVHLFLRNNLSPPKDIFLSLVPLFRNFHSYSVNYLLKLAPS